MTHELVAALEAEIDSLEAELREDIRFVRLQALRQALALYVDPNGALDRIRAANAHVTHPGNVARGPTFHSSAKSDLNPQGSGSRSAGRRTSLEKARALDAAAMLLRNRSGPVPTRDILEHLSDFGIDIGGSSPINNLSATLSNSDRFKPVGRAGWVLNEVDNNQHVEANEIDPGIYRRISMEFLDEQTFDGISAISNHVEFTGELPDEVKDELAARFKVETEYDYEINSGNFHHAFIRELEDVAAKLPEADAP